MPSAEIVVQSHAVGGREIPVVTSRQIASKFGKRHDDVMRAIRNLEVPEEFSLRNFAESDYTNNRGKSYPEYLVTEKGFSVLVMGFTGKEAMEWKIRFLEAFDAMHSRAQELAAIPSPAPAELIAAGIRIAQAEAQVESMEMRLEEAESSVDWLLGDRDKHKAMADERLPCMHLWNRLVRGSGSVGFLQACALLGVDESAVSGLLVANGICSRHPRTRRLSVCNPPAVKGVAEPAVYQDEHGRSVEGVRVTGYGLCYLSGRIPVTA